MKTKIVILNSLLLCAALSGQRMLGAETTKANLIEMIVRSDSLDASVLFERFSKTNEAPGERVLRRAADCARLARRCYENNDYVKAVRFADVFFSELSTAQTSGIVFTPPEQLRGAVLRFYVYERILGDHASALVAAQECAELS